MTSLYNDTHLELKNNNFLNSDLISGDPYFFPPLLLDFKSVAPVFFLGGRLSGNRRGINLKARIFALISMKSLIGILGLLFCYRRSAVFRGAPPLPNYLISSLGAVFQSRPPPLSPSLTSDILQERGKIVEYHWLFGLCLWGSPTLSWIDNLLQLSRLYFTIFCDNSHLINGKNV